MFTADPSHKCNPACHHKVSENTEDEFLLSSSPLLITCFCFMTAFCHTQHKLAQIQAVNLSSRLQ